MTMKLMDGRYMAEAKKVDAALEAVKKLEAVQYVENGIGGGTKYGVIGGTVVAAFPFAGQVDGVGMHRVDLEQLIPGLVAAVQELSAKVEALEAKKTVKKAAAKVTNEAA